MLVDGDGEDGFVATKNGGGAVTMMHVGVDDHCFADGFVGLQPPDGYGDIVDRAKPFTVASVRVMEPATEICAKPVAESALSSKNRSAGR